MLPIQLSGHGIEITPTLHDFIHKKFERIRKHSDHITNIHIYLDVNKVMQAAEARIHITGHEIYAKAETDDMYKTIDFLIDKVVRQLEKFKDKHH